MGTKKQTILILNGRRYDALTGEMVDDDGQHHAVQPIMDVVGQRAENPAPQTPTPDPVPQPVAPLASHKVMDISRTAGHTKRRQPQRATTLVRTAVRKPKPGIKNSAKVNAPASGVSAAPITTTITPKWPVSQVNPQRQSRSQSINKSQAISKFAPGAVVSSAPVPAQTTQAAAPARAVDAIEHQSQHSRDLFERAIAAADSHTQPAYNPKQLKRQARKQARSAVKATRPVRHHLATVVAASVAVLVIGTTIGLQHKTDITMRFANAKAGFNASIPAYQPTGYKVANMEYSAGNVGLNFQNDTADRAYELSQQTTTWNSEELLNNFVTMNYKSYQALQSGDQIIYVYGKNDASWIKNGIWYQLTSNGSLSTSEVLNIATSV